MRIVALSIADCSSLDAFFSLQTAANLPALQRLGQESQQRHIGDGVALLSQGVLHELRDPLAEAGGDGVVLEVLLQGREVPPLLLLLLVRRVHHRGHGAHLPGLLFPRARLEIFYMRTDTSSLEIGVPLKTERLEKNLKMFIVQQKWTRLP